MTYSFDDSFRREVANRCAAFSRLPGNDLTRGLKHSAVAIALTDTEDGSGGAAFLMTRRTRDLRAHRGQWALPGGRCDEGETPVEAVLRELDEEISLRLDATDVLGILDDYATRSGYLITPVVVCGAL
jgi:8-oxo-dGTP pyrophosphatase MutT (NUDIX family)